MSDKNSDNSGWVGVGMVIGMLIGILMMSLIFLSYTRIDDTKFECTNERVVNHKVVCYQYSRTEEK